MERSKVAGVCRELLLQKLNQKEKSINFLRYVVKNIPVLRDDAVSMMEDMMEEQHLTKDDLIFLMENVKSSRPVCLKLLLQRKDLTEEDQLAIARFNV